MPPHPFPAERLDLPHQHRRAPRLDTTPMDRPRSTTPRQRPRPTHQNPTPTAKTRPATTAANRGSMNTFTSAPRFPRCIGSTHTRNRLDDPSGVTATPLDSATHPLQMGLAQLCPIGYR